MSFSKKALCALPVLVCLLSAPAGAQMKRVPWRAGEHIIAVVPMIGSGTPDDPQRPMFAPSPKEMIDAATSGDKPAILSYHFELGDDGKTAIVEFVASDLPSFQTVRDAATAGIIKAYLPQQIGLSSLNIELRKVKQSFDLLQFRTRIPALVLASATAAAAAGAQ